MPKFKVCVQQYVEEIAHVMVEAETPEKAVEIAEQKLADGDIDNWRDGDDIIQAEAYAVLDETGESVWDR